MSATTEKVCKRCGGDPQPAANFYVSRRAKDGLQSYCKACDAERSAAQYASGKEGQLDPYRRKQTICRLCFGLAHRVTGAVCPCGQRGEVAA